MKKASENFRRGVNDALRRMLPALWAALCAAEGYDPLTPPSFPGANDPGIRAAILASVYDAMSGRALRASGNIDPAHSNLSACISPIGAPAASAATRAVCQLRLLRSNPLPRTAAPRRLRCTDRFVLGGSLAHRTDTPSLPRRRHTISVHESCQPGL